MTRSTRTEQAREARDLGETGVPDDLWFVDCDSHWTEPRDLWSSRVAASQRHLVPHLTRNGARDSWFLNGEPWATTGSNVIGVDDQKISGAHMMNDYDDISASAYSVRDRLALMDQMRCHSAVIYPNGVGFASNHMFAIEDVAQRRLVLSVYNDFFVDLQHDSGGRLRPQAMLPIWDMDFTVREITRMLDQGMSGFTMSDKPELIGLPELWDTYYDPMWDALNESRAAVNFHIGSGVTRDQMEAGRRYDDEKATTSANDAGASGESAAAPAQPKAELAGYTAVAPSWKEFGRKRKLAVGATQAGISNMRIITNLCFSSLFDRFPNLRMVSAESGVGWVPFLLETMEHQFSEMVGDSEEREYTQRRPTEYFHDHIYVMWWFERSGPQKLLYDVGVRNVLVETDVPHSTCLYPNPRDHFVDVLKEVPTVDVRRVLYENAAELYKIDA